MKTQVIRFDKGELQNAERTPQGFLRVPVYATRAGVFTYKTGDGKIIRELRPPEEVFKADSLQSLSGAPFTLRHPPEMITPKNVTKYQKGHVLENIRQDGDKVSCSVIISDADAIAAVENGMREVSCGYHADVFDEAGIFQGQPYDVVQRNIRYNHLAATDKGRAGPEVRIRLDAADAVMEQEPSTTTHKENSDMEKINIGGKEFEVSKEVKTAIESEQTKAKETSAKLDSAQTEISGLKKTNEDLTKTNSDLTKSVETTQAKLDTANDDLKKRTDSAPDESKVRELVKSRINLEKVASHALPKEKLEKLDSMSDVEIKKSVIQADSPTAQLDGKSDVYIETRFDAIAEKVRARADFNSGIGRAIVANDARKDEKEPDASDARAKMRKDSEDEWKKPLASAQEKSN